MYYSFQEFVRPSFHAIIHSIEGNKTVSVQPRTNVVVGVVADVNALSNATELSKNVLFLTTFEDSELDLSNVFRVISTGENVVNVSFLIDRGAQLSLPSLYVEFERKSVAFKTHCSCFALETRYVANEDRVDDVLLFVEDDDVPVRLSIRDSEDATAFTELHRDFTLRGPLDSINTILTSGITFVLDSDFTGVSKLTTSLESVPFSSQAEISVYADKVSDSVVFSDQIEEKQRVAEDGRLNLVLPTLTDVDDLANLELTIST